MRLRLVVPVLVIFIAPLSACSGSVSAGSSALAVAASDVEDTIVSQLTTAEGVSPDSASCPEDLEGKVGEVITCTITDAQGDQDVEVEVTSVDGTDVKFDINPVS